MIALRTRHLFLLLLAVGACRSSLDGVSVDLPASSPGIGFDDLRYSASLHRVLVPAGRSGNLVLVDPDTRTITTITGFSKSADFGGGHDFGATSVDEGAGLLFVTDRTSQRLVVVDPNTRQIVGVTSAGAGPDYVRFVASTRELWVTEPDASRIEVFSLPASGALNPSSVATIPVDNGPESLVIDQGRGRAYTHRWQKSTVVLDVKSRGVIGEWQNGCAASRGLALDEKREFFFASCSEGTVSVLSTRDGRILSSIARGSGFDVMGYSASLGHLYLAGTSCSCLVMLRVSAAGALSFLDRFDATSSAHCAVADDSRHAWVCDPDKGRLIRFDDAHPASF